MRRVQNPYEHHLYKLVYGEIPPDLWSKHQRLMFANPHWTVRQEILDENFNLSAPALTLDETTQKTYQRRMAKSRPIHKKLPILFNIVKRVDEDYKETPVLRRACLDPAFDVPFTRPMREDIDFRLRMKERTQNYKKTIRRFGVYARKRLAYDMDYASDIHLDQRLTLFYALNPEVKRGTKLGKGKTWNELRALLFEKKKTITVAQHRWRFPVYWVTKHGARMKKRALRSDQVRKKMAKWRAIKNCKARLALV